MAQWKALQPGDIIDVVAPAWDVPQSDIQRGLAVLKKWGLVPRVPKNLIRRDFIYSNTEENRLQHFKAALAAKDSKAIYCIRGGSGSTNLIPELNRVKKDPPQKILIGLSDISALHIFLAQKWNMVGLHAAMLKRLGAPNQPRSELSELKNVLFGNKTEVAFLGLKPLNSAAKKRAKIRGRVMGGNLCTVECGLGTPWEIDGRSKILFFEEVDERAYRVERMLEHLSQAGTFRGAKAVVFGDFTYCHEKNGKSLVPLALKRFADRVNVPVLTGIKSGHGKLQRCVPLNTMSELSLGSKISLTCSTGGQK